MELFGKKLDQEVVIVAEIGVNHEGDLDSALHMMKLAAVSGADAVKFQSYTPERYASASDPGRLDRVKKFALSKNDHEVIAKEAEKLGVGVFSTPLTEDVVTMLDELFPVFKIASGDLNFEPVVRSVAKRRKPIILSTGLATIEEINSTIQWVREEIGQTQLRDRLVLMHCVSAYPTDIEKANVRSIPWLAEKTGLRIGYSNHVLGLEACYCAIALGACIIEVHFTDNKLDREFRDHALSCDPQDLRELVQIAKGIKASLGTYSKHPQDIELPNLLATRKGIVAATNLEAGHELRLTDLMFARPATEFSASEIHQLLGCKIIKPIKQGELVTRSNVNLKG